MRLNREPRGRGQRQRESSTAAPRATGRSANTAANTTLPRASATRDDQGVVQLRGRAGRALTAGGCVVQHQDGQGRVGQPHADPPTAQPASTTGNGTASTSTPSVAIPATPVSDSPILTRRSCDSRTAQMGAQRRAGEPADCGRGEHRAGGHRGEPAELDEGQRQVRLGGREAGVLETARGDDAGQPGRAASRVPRGSSRVPAIRTRTAKPRPARPVRRRRSGGRRRRAAGCTRRRAGRPEHGRRVAAAPTRRRGRSTVHDSSSARANSAIAGTPRKTQRQPNDAAIWAARYGPTSPGSTHAPDSTANTRGRDLLRVDPGDQHIDADTDQAAAEALQPTAGEEDRHAVGQAGDSSPTTKTATPTVSGRPGPAPVHPRPADRQREHRHRRRCGESDCIPGSFRPGRWRPGGARWLPRGPSNAIRKAIANTPTVVAPIPARQIEAGRAAEVPASRHRCRGAVGRRRRRFDRRTFGCLHIGLAV